MAGASYAASDGTAGEARSRVAAGDTGEAALGTGERSRLRVAAAAAWVAGATVCHA